MAESSTTVTGEGDPPVAVDDSAGIYWGYPLKIDLLGNDLPGSVAIDPDSLRIETPPPSGEVTILEDGLVRYTASPGFVGQDEFLYRVDGLVTRFEYRF